MLTDPEAVDLLDAMNTGHPGFIAGSAPTLGG
jgi:Flp pilus assembly CpaF family ATPase